MTTIERMPYLSVAAMTAADARRFFGAPDDARTEDAGPADPTRYKDGARVWHVYPKETAGCEVCQAVRASTTLTGVDVTILVDGSEQQPMPGVQLDDGWLAWDIGGGFAYACEKCAGTVTVVEGPVPS